LEENLADKEAVLVRRQTSLQNLSEEFLKANEIIKTLQKDNAMLKSKVCVLLAKDSTLSPHNKLTLYKLLIRPFLTLPQSGAIRPTPTIVIFKPFSRNVFKS
jgi:hypothetical protein